MVFTKDLVILTMKILTLMILFQNSNQETTSVYSGLLSRLYKKAAESNRPLIVILDSDFLASNQIPYKRYRLDNTGKQLISDKHKDKEFSLNRLLGDKYQPSLVTPEYKDIKMRNSLDHFEGLLPLKKKRSQRNKKEHRSPIIKNLLRISNNLRCQARDECDNECSVKFSGAKQNKCSYICEVKFECEPEEESDDCDDDCEESIEFGSTKGYASTDPKPECPEC